jgi:hypothetical protein
MTDTTSYDLAAVIRSIRHRIDAHKAALRIAEELGNPAVLDYAVRDSHARLDEAATILALLVTEVEQ